MGNSFGETLSNFPGKNVHVTSNSFELRAQEDEIVLTGNRATPNL